MSKRKNNSLNVIENKKAKLENDQKVFQEIANSVASHLEYLENLKQSLVEYEEFVLQMEKKDNEINEQIINYNNKTGEIEEQLKVLFKNKE